MATQVLALVEAAGGVNSELSRRSLFRNSAVNDRGNNPPANDSKSVADEAHQGRRTNHAQRVNSNAQNVIAAATSRKHSRAVLEKTFEPLSPLQKRLLARRLGHASFGSLLAASSVVTLSDGSAWWLTADRNGAWTAWNLCNIESPNDAKTSDEMPAPPGKVS